MHRKLVETVRAGFQIIETVIKSGLTDRAAYRLESRMIGEFHKFRLWRDRRSAATAPRAHRCGQQAMAHAMIYPEPEKGGRKTLQKL
jgi:hypothetical protein